MDHEAALITVETMLNAERITKGHNEKRLAEYIADYEEDEQLDTAAQISRTRKKIVANAERIEVLEYVAGVLDIDREFNRVYEAAASLFDSNETVDLTKEYHRGVTELVMRLMGIDSDDKDDVAATITRHAADTRTPRQKIDAVIFHKFPDRLMTFYTNDDHMAAVEDKNGDMWRVWPDGDTEHYKR